MKCLILILLLPIFIGSCYLTLDIHKREMINVREEGKCISMYISRGVPRKDIQTNNGTCYIKE